jgi:hypothetical protein
LQQAQSVSTKREPAVGQIIFSLEDGTIWANWPGKAASIELGQYEEVTIMMRDFLAQCDLAERLASRKVSNG